MDVCLAAAADHCVLMTNLSKKRSREKIAPWATDVNALAVDIHAGQSSSKTKNRLSP
jgi:hypothetical protein